MSIQRSEILKCARDIYLKEGFGGMSMRKLAKCVGCTAPALYRHYESKEGVMQDVVVEAYRLFSQYLNRALAGGSPPERFGMAGQAYVDFALEHPALYETLYVPLDLLGIHQDSANEVASLACAVGQFWSDRVREMMDTGFLKKGDPQTVSLTLWAHGHGLVSLYHRGLLPDTTEQEIRALIIESYAALILGVGTEQYLGYLRDESPEGNREIWQAALDRDRNGASLHEVEA